jgi:ubiquilin
MNPFTMNPALLQSMLDAGGGGFAYGGGAAPAPADTRPPEERFQVQLQVCVLLAHCYSTDDSHSLRLIKQLQDMGFMNAAQNVRALLATGGNVHSAIEYILSGGGL